MIFGFEAPSVEFVVFFLAGAIVLGGASGVVWSRNPVHSALSLIATLFGIAVLFLNENAQLLAAVQVIVYTGAIVVLILFVLMLLGVDTEEDVYTEPLLGQRTFGAIIAMAIFAIVFGVFFLGGSKVIAGPPNCVNGAAVIGGNAYEPQCTPVDANLATVSPDRPNVNQVGRVLFTDFAFAFEITAGLLTIAVVGAVWLAKRPKDLAPEPGQPEDMDYVDLIAADEGEAH
jgi:NADH-quinone oxidoreductase subunit J